MEYEFFQPKPRYLIPDTIYNAQTIAIRTEERNAKKYIVVTLEIDETNNMQDVWLMSNTREFLRAIGLEIKEDEHIKYDENQILDKKLKFTTKIGREKKDKQTGMPTGMYFTEIANFFKKDEEPIIKKIPKNPIKNDLNDEFNFPPPQTSSTKIEDIPFA